MLSSLGATAAQPAPADLKKKASLGPNSTPLVKVQKTPVFIDDVTLAHLSHLFLGVRGGRGRTSIKAFPAPSKQPRIDDKLSGTRVLDKENQRLGHLNTAGL